MSTDTIVVDDDEILDILKQLGLTGRAVGSPAKVAEVLDCGLSRVYKMIDTGELPSFLIGGRRKIAFIDIARLIAKRRAAPLVKRVCPWDVDGLAERQYHPRREAEDRPRPMAEQPQQRPVGRPRKAGSRAQPHADAAR